MILDLGTGDGFYRHQELQAEAEREYFLRSVRTARRRAPAGRIMRVRQRVGLALIRRGEEIAGVCAGSAVRLS